MLISSIIKDKENKLQKKESLKQSAIDFFKNHLDMPGGFKDRIEKDIENNLGDQYKIDIEFNLMSSVSQDATTTQPKFIVQIFYNKESIFFASYYWHSDYFSKNNYPSRSLLAGRKLYNINWKMPLNPSDKDLMKMHNKIYNVLAEDIKDNIKI